MSAANEVTDVNTMHRANLVTTLTTIALAVIYGRNVVNKGYGAVGTSLYTLAAGYTAVLANLAHISTLVVVVTLNNNGGGVIYQMDNAVGAGFCTKTATDTTAWVNFSNSLFGIYANRISGTNGNTVTVAKAGKGAKSVAGKALICYLAALRAVINILSFFGNARAVTSNIGNLFNNISRNKSHNVGNLFSSAVTAGNTKGGVVGFALGESFCIAVTAREAAGSAVCTGEAISYRRRALVLLYREERRSNGK